MRDSIRCPVKTRQTTIRREERTLKEIGIPVKTSQFQKSVLLGTARILRKVLEV